MTDDERAERAALTIYPAGPDAENGGIRYRSYKQGYLDGMNEERFQEAGRKSDAMLLANADSRLIDSAHFHPR